MASSSRFAVAIHVLALMARSGDEALKSEQVASSVNTNPVVIRRILRELARARLVTSQTGAAGGSRLAHPPAQITLLDVYRAIEAGDIFSLHRQPPNRQCFVGMHIETVLGGVLEEVSTAVESVLVQITIENVLERLRPCRPARGRKAGALKARARKPAAGPSKIRP